MHRYKVWNAPMQTTAGLASVTTGTVIKTMLQLATPSTRQIQLLSWGFSLTPTPTTGPNLVELLQTDVAATVTAHVASGVQPLDPNAPPSLLTLGTTATGFTATAEGAITTTRTFDACLIPPTAGAYDHNYRYQEVLDERPIMAVSKFLRVRVTFATAANMLCWVCYDE